MNYIDLFSGIGGFALGAYWAGMKFDKHYFSEVEPYCVELYQKRFPDAIPLGDIREIDCEKLADTASVRRESNRELATRKYMGQEETRSHATEGGGNSWLITGGFPCQDISVAGKGEGIGGERSGLWFEMWRIIRELRPRWVIAENVGALTFRGLDAVLNSLAEIGYDAEWQDIRAEDVGAPHRRERIWIVAYPPESRSETRSGNGMGDADGSRRDERLPESTGGQEMAHPEDPDAASNHGAFTNQNSNATVADAEREGCIGRGSRGAANQNRMEAGKQTGQEPRSATARCSQNSWWAVEPDVGRLAHGVPHRVDRLKGLGNAIVPQIAELLFRQIKEVL